jgi:hypothetical protein
MRSSDENHVIAFCLQKRDNRKFDKEFGSVLSGAD